MVGLEDSTHPTCGMRMFTALPRTTAENAERSGESHCGRYDESLHFVHLSAFSAISAVQSLLSRLGLTPRAILLPSASRVSAPSWTSHLLKLFRRL